MTTWHIECRDVMKWANEYDGPLFHAVLCDAPYEMEFMGKEWDGSGVSFDPDTWRNIARHLLPGAFLFVFAGTINDDLISLAMRKAGLRKHHKAVYWGQGQGFPKSARIDTQIDKAAGKLDERRVIGRYQPPGMNKPWNLTQAKDERTVNVFASSRNNLDLEEAATPLARTWAGHRYGLQAIKPSVESILIFQKPYEGRPVDSIVETGAGALWIDGGRIGTSDNTSRPPGHGSDENWRLVNRTEPSINHSSGRWPANLLLSHIPPHTCPDCGGDGCNACGGEGLVGGCVRVGEKRIKGTNKPGKPGRRQKQNGWALANGGDFQRQDYTDPDGKETVADWRCVESCPVRQLGEQSGERPSAGRYLRINEIKERPRAITGRMAGKELRNSNAYAGESGTAARFFFQADWSHEIAEQIERAAPVHYQAKASRRERDAGLDGMAKQFLATMGDGIGAREHNPKQPTAWVRNPHPTCKPIALAKHLATLLLPPPEYAPRRLLIPFCGTMSEGIGAMLAGWEEIVGIDIVPDYCDIAEARLAWWADWMEHTGVTDVKELLRLSNNGKVRAEKEAKRLL